MHVQKRAKMDLDSNSVVFLVLQMRLELERIPEDEKRALKEAQMKCCAEEFSDARLERFLRCEGMNAKVRLDVYMCPFSFVPKDTGSLISYFGPSTVNRTVGSTAVCKLLEESQGSVWT
jgi:hypothetical protein